MMEQKGSRMAVGTKLVLCAMLTFVVCMSLAFPPDTHGKKSGAKGNAKGSTVIEGTVCPVCGKGKMRENYAAFGCTEPGCKCTLWKDCLTRGGGPARRPECARGRSAPRL